MKVKVQITLTREDDTGEEREMQVQIEESIPEGLQMHYLETYWRDLRILILEK